LKANREEEEEEEAEEEDQPSHYHCWQGEGDYSAA
jgi:hypothetical protein